MSRRQFQTQIRDAGMYPSPKGECCACDQVATGWLRIAYDYMRGNDDFEDACARHWNMAKNPRSLDRFFAHMRTKSRFVANKATLSQPPEKEAER